MDRWSRVAWVALGVGIGLYVWGSVLANEAERERQGCLSAAEGVLFGALGCMGYLFVGAGQFAAAYTAWAVALVCALIPRWRRWRTGRPQREMAAIEREIADIDAELDALNRRGS